ERLEVGRQAGRQATGGEGVVRADLVERVQRRFAQEGQSARQQLVEDGAQRVDVDGGGHLSGLAGGLLRGHVGRGPQDGPAGGRGGFRIGQLGEAAVGDPGLERGQGRQEGGLLRDRGLKQAV